MKKVLILILFFGSILTFTPAMAATTRTSTDYTVITAEGLEKSVERLEDNIRRFLPESTGRRIGLKDPEAQKIIRENDIELLPFVYFKEGFEKEKEFFLLAKQGIIDRKGNIYTLNSDAIRPFGALLLKSDRIPERLDVYTMSFCPYGQQALKYLIDRIQGEKLKIDLKVRYITKFRKYGIDSLHGDDEIEEDIRQLLVQKYYPDKFFKYLLTRPGSSFKETAKELSLDEKSISDKQEEGRRLLEEDAKSAEKLGITASPTFLYEGRYIFYSQDEIPLAKAEGPAAGITATREATKNKSSQLVDLFFFYKPSCSECRKIKDKMLPELKNKYGHAVNISYYDISEKGSYQKMIQLELKHGVIKKGTIPQVYIYPAGYALIGKFDIEQNLDGLLKTAVRGGK
jgi:glutaredoxin